MRLRRTYVILIATVLLVGGSFSSFGQIAGCRKKCMRYANGDVKCEDRTAGDMSSCTVVDNCMWVYDPVFGDWVQDCESDCSGSNCYDV